MILWHGVDVDYRIRHRAICAKITVNGFRLQLDTVYSLRPHSPQLPFLMVFVGEIKKKCNLQIKNLHKLTVFSPTIEIMCDSLLTPYNVSIISLGSFKLLIFNYNLLSRQSYQIFIVVICYISVKISCVSF
jgi:hypothetical protein